MTSNIPTSLPTYPSELLEQFERDIKKMLPLMKDFLGHKAEMQIALDDDPQASTFSFAPAKRIINVPRMRYIRYLQGEHLYTPELFQFILLHEAGHYRDLLKEEEITGTSTMLKCLKALADKKIVLNSELTIPTGEIFHDCYNCIDDVVVNTDVMKYIAANLSPAFLSTTYQTNNFPIYRSVAGGGEYQKNGQ
ncbi:MAG: hypothetical protein LBD75_03410 [Candidatus Peribacteria bacterium]|jgi:hypothetical protein|nr:hypothetical protein [Candidatus Peribacteria bacterium]